MVIIPSILAFDSYLIWLLFIVVDTQLLKLWFSQFHDQVKKQHKVVVLAKNHVFFFVEINDIARIGAVSKRFK